MALFIYYLTMFRPNGWSMWILIYAHMLWCPDTAGHAVETIGTGVLHVKTEVSDTIRYDTLLILMYPCLIAHMCSECHGVLLLFFFLCWSFLVSNMCIWCLTKCHSDRKSFFTLRKLEENISGWCANEAYIFGIEIL